MINYTGKARRVEKNGLDLEDLCKKICEELELTDGDSTYYSYVDILMSETEGESTFYVEAKGELYEVFDVEEESIPEAVITPIEDGLFSFKASVQPGYEELCTVLEYNL